MGNSAKNRRKQNLANIPCCQRKHPQVGDDVSIYRTEHGWYDGRIGGIVKNVYHDPTTGRVSYAINGEDGKAYFCPKTGDCK